MAGIYLYAEDCDISREKIVVEVDSDIRDLIPSFLETRQRDIKDLTVALNNKVFPTIKRVGHNMKGEGGSYGFDEITTIGTLMEEAAKEQDCAKISDLISDLSDYLERVEIVYK